VSFGLALLLAGFGFKVAMFRLHVGPDTYQRRRPGRGVPLRGAQGAAIAALFRLYFELFAERVPELTGWIAALPR